jgi:hypothetical protein
MATKQQRKTALRKSRQAARRARERLIVTAMESYNGPKRRETAEAMSNERLKHIARYGKRRVVVVPGPGPAAFAARLAAGCLREADLALAPPLSQHTIPMD